MERLDRTKLFALLVAFADKFDDTFIDPGYWARNAVWARYWKGDKEDTLVVVSKDGLVLSIDKNGIDVNSLHECYCGD